MVNLFEEQAKAINQVKQSAKVVPFPTQKLAKQLHAQGLVLVHKPASLATFNDGDLPPEAA